MKIYLLLAAIPLLAACAPAVQPSPSMRAPIPNATPTTDSTTQEERVPFDVSDWRTDFNNHSVPF